MTQGFHYSYNDSLKEAKRYKMQRPSHNRHQHTFRKDSSVDTEKKV